MPNDALDKFLVSKKAIARLEATKRALVDDLADIIGRDAAEEAGHRIVMRVIWSAKKRHGITTQ